MKRRSTLTFTAHTVTKQFHHPAAGAVEIGWYLSTPWACPQLVDADPDRGMLVIARHAPAHRLPEYRPAQQLLELLQQLEQHSVHHRDVWPGNIVATPDGPKLIDWETAIRADAPSYDLHGPTSGVGRPGIHKAVGRYCMWWGSTHPQSIKNRWGVDVSAYLARG